MVEVACVVGGEGSIFGERAKQARHYQGCTNSSWCGIYIFIPPYVTFNTRDWSKSVD